jgi:hypothetical protein
MKEIFLKTEQLPSVSFLYAQTFALIFVLLVDKNRFNSIKCAKEEPC